MIKVFDLTDPPEDFDPDALRDKREYDDIFGKYHRYGNCRRRYAIVHVKNTIGNTFFHNSIDKWDADCVFDFVNMGFCMFPDYDSLPDAIKRNAVGLFLETSADCKTIPAWEDTIDRRNSDFVLVREYVFDNSECKDMSDVDLDLEILDNLYYCGSAGGRYYTRMPWISAELPERTWDPNEVDYEGEHIIFWSYGGKYFPEQSG